MSASRLGEENALSMRLWLFFESQARMVFISRFLFAHGNRALYPMKRKFVSVMLIARTPISLLLHL